MDTEENKSKLEKDLLITKYNYDKICRTCLKCSGGNMKSVFESEILTMLTSFTTITLDVNDGLPQQICSNCCSKMFESYSFKQQCENSDQLLRQILTVQNNDFTNSESDLKPITENSVTVKLEVDGEDIKPSLETNEDSNKFSDTDDYQVADDDIETSFNNIKSDCSAQTVKRTVNREAMRDKILSTWGEEQCDPEKLLCKVCNKILANFNSLHRHMGTHSKKRRKSSKCKLCNKGFYDSSTLRKHMMRHKGEARYECDHCKKPFYELCALRLHCKKNHPDIKVSCKECENKFYTEKDLELHMKTHGDQQQHVCNDCGKVFRFQSFLRDHQWVHSKERAFHCDQCDKSYKSKSLLRSHVTNAHSNDRVREVCNICGKAVVYLKGHMIIHNDDKCNCFECGQEFKNRYSLSKHIKRKHKNIDEAILKPYLCNICGKRCENLSVLKRHLLTHTDVRTHKCPVCGKCFKANERLEFHIKHTHNDVRNHKCTYCSKSFHTASALTCHVRVHTGERPYVCKLCLKAFQQRSSLNTHMKVHGLNSKNASEEISRSIEVHLPKFKKNLQANNNRPNIN